jgi:general secretion pathway protein F
MTAFSFEAMDASGKTRRGVVDADSLKAARGQLRGQGLIPLGVFAVSGGGTDAGEGLQTGSSGTGGSWLQRRILGPTALATWTRQLAGLVTAGLPIERALSALADDAENERTHHLIAALRAEVHAGSSFARALSQHPREFSDIYTAVISAGESSGGLGLVLERLADDLEAQQALKSRLLGAALYPAIVSVVAVVIVLFLMGYVVPQVVAVFAGSKRALPLITVVMMTLSDWVREWGFTAIVTMILIAIGARQMLAIQHFREQFDGFWLTLPILGRLARSYNAARFASTLSMLAAAGVPILKALQAAADTLNNRAMRADARQAQILVREGAPLANALAQKKRFPGQVAMFARLGEQTGQLPTMLQRAAKQLSDDVQRRAMQLTTVLEPLLIVAMGVVVMLIVLAVLLPIIQLNQLVK